MIAALHKTAPDTIKIYQMIPLCFKTNPTLNPLIGKYQNKLLDFGKI